MLFARNQCPERLKQETLTRFSIFNQSIKMISMLEALMSDMIVPGLV